MLDFLTKSITNLFGNKSDRDIKVLNPIVEEINREFATLHTLSDDQLRDKTADFKKRIAEHISPEKAEIEALRKQAEAPETDIEQKEIEYEKIDVIEKKIIDKIQDFLNEILPEAFAVVKETARRFKENKKTYGYGHNAGP